MSKADYGIDAPNIVRNLFLFSLGMLVITFFSFKIQSPLWFYLVIVYCFLTFLTLFISGCWMLYGIKVAKPKIISKMIKNLRLTGNEEVLDLGCGRGLLICEIAKHLPYGKVHGIDLWSAKDQSGNALENTLKNADQDGVKQRVTIHTGDARALPFPNCTFDAVVSSLCLHNIGDKKGRERALLEMLRVLKPGGKFAIAAIQRAKEYIEFLMTQGITVEYSKPDYSYCPPITIVEGKKL